MSASPFEKIAIAQRYANALYDLAKEASTIDAVEADMQSLDGLLQDSDDFETFISMPLYGRDEQTAAVQAIADKAGFHQHTRNTLSVLAQNRRLTVIPHMVKAFQAKLDEDRGVQTARVEVAAQMNGEQESQLKQLLNSAAGGKDIRLDIVVNKDLLGGMIVQIGSEMIDTSLRTRLNNLEHSLKETN